MNKNEDKVKTEEERQEDEEEEEQNAAEAEQQLQTPEDEEERKKEEIRIAVRLHRTMNMEEIMLWAPAMEKDERMGTKAHTLGQGSGSHYSGLELSHHTWVPITTQTNFKEREIFRSARSGVHFGPGDITSGPKLIGNNRGVGSHLQPNKLNPSNSIRTHKRAVVLDGQDAKGPNTDQQGPNMKSTQGNPTQTLEAVASFQVPFDGGANGAANGERRATEFRRLSPEEMVERRLRNFWFMCDAASSPKQQLSESGKLELEEGETEEEEGEQDEDDGEDRSRKTEEGADVVAEKKNSEKRWRKDEDGERRRWSTKRGERAGHREGDGNFGPNQLWA